MSATLRPLAAPGERALILIPSGEDFVVAFLACLHAGIIAVPAYPPRRNRNRDRVLSIHDDAQPALILTTVAAEGNVREALHETSAHVLVVDNASASQHPESSNDHPVHNSDHIAFLQYTSGSTGMPKGSIITHTNLLANLDAIQALLKNDLNDEAVNWRPPFHDMGLIGSILTPIHQGITTTLLTPEEFLRNPIKWLLAISSRPTNVYAGAPNFAYHLLVERVSDADLSRLDLSRWRIAINSSEPILVATLEQFTKRFASCGFRSDAWMPSYGLAENTLLTTARYGTKLLTPKSRAVEQGWAEDTCDNADSTRIISCGSPALDTRITIHHRETCEPLPDGKVGEIHVCSPSVALGYWRNEAATAAVFPQPSTLRTGDLGFIHNGELHVTGRVKDLIIIRGRNLYPQDIENCVAALLPAATGANSIAAYEFSGNGSGSGALGLLIEAPRSWVSALRKSDSEMQTHVRNIRQAVAETFEITADLIAFVAPGDFPRTSCGKVQRGASRDGVMNGTLPVIHQDQLTPIKHELGAFDQTLPGEDRELDALLRQGTASDRRAVNDGSRGFQPTVTNHEKTVSRSDTWKDGSTHGGNDDPPPSSNVAPRRDAFSSAIRGLKPTATGTDRSAVGENADVRGGELVQHLERGLLDFLHREKLGNLDAVPHDATFSSLGIDSLGAAALAIEIENTFGVKITDETLYDYPTLQRLAGYIESRLATSDDSGACAMPDALPQSSPFAERIAKAMERVNQLRAANLYLFHPVTSAVEPGHATLNGERMITFAGYEYLDIGAHPDVKEAMVKAIEGFGTGAHGASIMGGKTAYHDQLEQKLAALMKSEDALVYTSGFLTSFSTVAAFVGPGDVVIGDSFNHASIIDGCRMSGARFVSFTHGELEVLERALAENRSPHTLVVVDGVFSMDGDIANIPEISRLCRKYAAYLMVDEAHSIGATGATGRGVQEYFGLPSDAIDLKMGTLSKALGGVGGFVAGKAEVIDFLRHHSRGYMFAAALPAPNAAVSLAGLKVLEDEPWRVRSLQEKAKRWRDGVKALGFDTFASKTPVVPIRMPDQSTAFEFTSRCWRKGVVAMPVVFPAVAENAPRVRTFVTLGLSNDAIDRALEVFAVAGREVGLIR